MAKRVCLTLALVLCAVTIHRGQDAVKKRRPLPYEYGRVILNNYSEKSALAPVVFDHWKHRTKFTCRVCHVDIGFAMKGGATGITATDNMRGYYCGACHNGKTAFSTSDPRKCHECHKTKKNHHGHDDKHYD